MKVCSLCQREFDDQQQFCTRDGTKLTRVQERGYCRRCGKDYPVTLNKCPLHNTPLAEHGPRTILGDNFCHLCDSDFPKAFKLCPVHGIALQTSPLKKKLRKIDSDEPAIAQTDSNGSKLIEAEPPNTNPLPHLGAPKIEQVWATGDLPKTDALFHPKEAIPNITVGATRELDRSSVADNLVEVQIEPPKTDQIRISPVPVPHNAAPRRNPFRGLKSLNRRRIVFSVAVVLALIVSVGAYDLYVKRAAEESIRFSGEPANSGNNLAKKIDQKPDSNNAVDPSKTVNKPTPDPAATASTVGAVTTVQKNTVPVTTPTQTKAQTRPGAKPEAPGPEETTQSDKTHPIFVPKAQDPPVESPKKEDPKPQANTKDRKPDARDSFEQITPARPDTARVVASVRNRRRVAVPGGFHYYFEVVLTEVNGIGVNWENGVIERTSEAGFTTSKTAGYDFALAAHGHTQIRIEVDMLGSTTRDWRGTVLYTNKGIDDNGHVIRVKYRLPLDESFRD